MSIDDLTLTDLTIVNDTDVVVKIYCDCGRMWTNLHMVHEQSVKNSINNL